MSILHGADASILLDSMILRIFSKFTRLDSILTCQGVQAQPNLLLVFTFWVFRLTILAKWLRHFNGLAVGETAAPASFSRENAERAGMPPLLSY